MDCLLLFTYLLICSAFFTSVAFRVFKAHETKLFNFTYDEAKLCCLNEGGVLALMDTDYLINQAKKDLSSQIGTLCFL